MEPKTLFSNLEEDEVEAVVAFAKCLIDHKQDHPLGKAVSVEQLQQEVGKVGEKGVGFKQCFELYKKFPVLFGRIIRDFFPLCPRL
jgi:hypothetical protein